MTANVTAVAASTVRSYARENRAALVKHLSSQGIEDTDSVLTCLGDTARGRLNPHVVEFFNSRHKGIGKSAGKAYVEKTPVQRMIEVEVPTTDKRGRARTKTVSVPMAEVRATTGKGKGALSREGKIETAYRLGLVARPVQASDADDAPADSE